MIEPIQEFDFSDVPIVHSFMQQSVQWTIILKFTWTRNLIATSSLSTNTQANLWQHIRGTHGRGWVSPCGVKYSWPPKMFRHHKKCQKCKLMKQKKETGAEKLAKQIGKENAKKKSQYHAMTLYYLDLFKCYYRLHMSVILLGFFKVYHKCIKLVGFLYVFFSSLINVGNILIFFRTQH